MASVGVISTGWNKRMTGIDLDIVSGDIHAEVKATTIHGILWLQTHFDNSEWDTIASGTFMVSALTLSELQQDAQDAGLNVRSRRRWQQK